MLDLIECHGLREPSVHSTVRERTAATLTSGYVVAVPEDEATVAHECVCDEGGSTA